MRTLSILVTLVVTCAAQEDALTVASNDLGFLLLRALASSKEDNVFFSPHGIFTMMGMVYAGAKGKTLETLFHDLRFVPLRTSFSEVMGLFEKRFMRMEFQDTPGFTLQMANAVVIDENFNVSSDYERKLERYLGAALLKIGFKERGQTMADSVNWWVKRHTDKIEKLIEGPLSPDTKLLLLNAIYFNGVWNTPFNGSNTAQRMLLNGGVNATRVDIMSGKFMVNYGISKALQVSVVDLPYHGLTHSMTIVLPFENDGADSVKSRLTGDRFRKLVAGLRPLEVELFLPKFRLEKKYSLKDPLESVGIQDIFNDTADLSGISEQRELRLSAVEHKAVVEVDEKGTRASSAAGVGVRPLSWTRTFNADHPFFFVIRNTQTGDIMFIGQVSTL